MAQQRPKQLNSPLLPKIFKVAGKAHVWGYRRTGAKVGGNRLIGAGFRKPVPTLLLEHPAESPARYSSRRCSICSTAPTS
jgi:hypothetical protein